MKYVFHENVRKRTTHHWLLMVTKYNRLQVKHLGLVLDYKLDFNEHFNNEISKCNRIMSVEKRLSLTLSRKRLLKIYKFLGTPNLYNADIIFDEPFNECFKSKLEIGQYHAVLEITGAF